MQVFKLLFSCSTHTVPYSNISYLIIINYLLVLLGKMYHFFLHLIISDITSVHHTALSTKVEFDKASQINMQRQKLNNYKKKDRPFKNKYKH